MDRHNKGLTLELSHTPTLIKQVKTFKRIASCYSVPGMTTPTNLTT